VLSFAADFSEKTVVLFGTSHRG